MSAKIKDEHVLDSDTSSGSEDEVDKSRKEISRAHEKLLGEAHKNRLHWIPGVLDAAADVASDDRAEKTKFESEYKDKLRGGKRNNTIVHTLVELMVEKPWNRANCFKPLLQLILQLDSRILGVHNQDGKWAFNEAVYERKSHLVELLCQIAPSPESVIEKKNGKDNALHQAIKRNKANFQPTIQVLIKNCKDETLKEEDEDGNTPLHLAVNHRYFVEIEKHLVQDLVIKCPSSLKCENKSKLTPLLYLQDCKERHKESKAVEKKQGGKKDLIKKEDGKKVDEAAQMVRRTTETSQNPEDVATDRVAYKYEPNAKALRGPEKNKGEDTKGVRKPGLSDDQVRSIFNNIESFLKKFILQKFSHSDHNIDFNLLPVLADRRLSPEMIKKNYAFLKFESTLQYVALPNLSPIYTNSSVDMATDKDIETEILKPTHYYTIFKWLKDVGNVKEILRIIVEDDPEHPHDDETIERTIKGLGVEVWDWKKYDISSETIRIAAPDVREVYLYTTGNSAVLLGWSDQDGLRNLKNLEKIRLSIKASETSTRTKQNVDNFKERLSKLVTLDRTERLIRMNDLKMLLDRPQFANQSGSDINLDDFICEAQKLPVRGNTAPKPFKITTIYEGVSERSHTDQRPKTLTSDQVRAHRWLDCVDKCAQWVRNMEKHKRPVKVALIDDGVDSNHDRLRENIKGGKTYCFSYPGKEEVTSSYYTSTSGHGTLMATLIRTVCPEVELFIAKLDDTRVSDGYGFTAQSAAEAVKWAVRMDVDIISMSWTIGKSYKDGQKKEALGELDRAIRVASSKDILMFCAARDEGLEQPTEIPFPAASDVKNIHVIGAAAPSRAASTWVNDTTVHFLFPGTELRESRPKLIPPGMPAVDGSSSATALASGLAGLLLCILSTDTKKEWDPQKSERRHEKINNILGSVRGDKKYVQVWDLFDQFIRKPGSEGDLKVLQNMVDTLLVYSKRQA